MDLTKYLKKDILYNDLGFSTGKSTHDLINEMQAQGLLVDFLEITGEIIRVPVKAIGGKPDTGGQKSGYYAVNQVGGHMFCTYGNWKTGFEGKWSSIDTNQLSIVDRQELQKQMKKLVLSRVQKGSNDKMKLQLKCKKSLRFATKPLTMNISRIKKLKVMG